MSNVRGRPRFISSPERFNELVDGYFKLCADSGEPVTLTGMVLALGLSSKGSLWEYLKYPEFKECVEVARTRIENAYEKRLIENGNPAAAIFALKNMGWTDKLIQEHQGGVEITQIQRTVVDPTKKAE